MTASATANICNTRGLHARASAKFVKLASTFDAEVHVTRDGVTVNALSIMGLLPDNASVDAGQILFKGQDLVALGAGFLALLGWAVWRLCK